MPTLFLPKYRKRENAASQEETELTIGNEHESKYRSIFVVLCRCMRAKQVISK